MPQGCPNNSCYEIKQIPYILSEILCANFQAVTSTLAFIGTEANAGHGHFMPQDCCTPNQRIGSYVPDLTGALYHQVLRHAPSQEAGLTQG